MNPTNTPHTAFLDPCDKTILPYFLVDFRRSKHRHYPCLSMVVQIVLLRLFVSMLKEVVEDIHSSFRCVPPHSSFLPPILLCSPFISFVVIMGVFFPTITVFSPLSGCWVFASSLGLVRLEQPPDWLVYSRYFELGETQSTLPAYHSLTNSTFPPPVCPYFVSDEKTSKVNNSHQENG